MLAAYIVLGVLTFIGLAITVPVLDKLDSRKITTNWAENLTFSFIAGAIWPISLITVCVIGFNKLFPVLMFTPGKWLDDNLIDKIVAVIKARQA